MSSVDLVCDFLIPLISLCDEGDSGEVTGCPSRLLSKTRPRGNFRMYREVKNVMNREIPKGITAMGVVCSYDGFRNAIWKDKKKCCIGHPEEFQSSSTLRSMLCTAVERTLIVPIEENGGQDVLTSAHMQWQAVFTRSMGLLKKQEFKSIRNQLLLYGSLFTSGWLLASELGDYPNRGIIAITDLYKIMCSDNIINNCVTRILSSYMSVGHSELMECVAVIRIISAIVGSDLSSFHIKPIRRPIRIQLQHQIQKPLYESGAACMAYCRSQGCILVGGYNMISIVPLLVFTSSEQLPRQWYTCSRVSKISLIASESGPQPNLITTIIVFPGNNTAGCLFTSSRTLEYSGDVVFTHSSLSWSVCSWNLDTGKLIHEYHTLATVTEIARVKENIVAAVSRGVQIFSMRTLSLIHEEWFTDDGTSALRTPIISCGSHIAAVDGDEIFIWDDLGNTRKRPPIVPTPDIITTKFQYEIKREFNYLINKGVWRLVKPANGTGEDYYFNVRTREVVWDLMNHIRSSKYVFEKRDRTRREKHPPDASDLNDLVDLKIKQENWVETQRLNPTHCSWIGTEGRELHDLSPLAAEVLPKFISEGGIRIDEQDLFPDPSHEVTINETEHLLVRKPSKKSPLCKHRLLLTKGSFVTSISSSSTHMFISQFDPIISHSSVTSIPLPVFTKPSLENQTVEELGTSTVECEGCVIKILKIDQGVAVATTDGSIRLVTCGIIPSVNNNNDELIASSTSTEQQPS